MVVQKILRETISSFKMVWKDRGDWTEEYLVNGQIVNHSKASKWSSEIYFQNMLYIAVKYETFSEQGNRRIYATQDIKHI